MSFPKFTATSYDFTEYAPGKNYIGGEWVDAASGESIRLDDAYSDDRFNPSVDKELEYRTRSILCLPVKNRAGSVFAVAQLLNRKDGRPFDDEDEEKYRSFLDSIGLILETLEKLLVKH